MRSTGRIKSAGSFCQGRASGRARPARAAAQLAQPLGRSGGSKGKLRASGGLGGSAPRLNANGLKNSAP